MPLLKQNGNETTSTDRVHLGHSQRARFNALDLFAHDIDVLDDIGFRANFGAAIHGFLERVKCGCRTGVSLSNSAHYCR